MPILTARPFFEGVKDPEYLLLASLAPGLYLDIGASDGHKTVEMLTVSPQSNVIAAEPFPGNVEQLQQNLGHDTRVTIVAKAISDKEGDVNFSVSSTVKESVGDRRSGYSSLGRIVEGPDPNAEINIVVPTIGIDEILNGRRATFVKIDVQGGEESVLRSASQSMRDGLIDIIYMEFSGNKNEIDIFSDNDYTIFDTKYLLIPRSDANTDAWDIINRTPFLLSNKMSAHNAWPKFMPTTDSLYAEFIQEQKKKVGWVQTDLICISPRARADCLRKILDLGLKTSPVRKHG